MSSRTRWLLPAGIEEVLPENAAVLELYRRKLLDLFSSWGYQLVIPPFIEFLDSLLIGDCEDLNLQTFKLTDQLSGRTMGVRADMTPQVARIDAHMLKENAPTRLCYCGTVLHTLPQTAGGSRSPLQIGAELYGHNGMSSDVEIIALMTATLKAAGTNKLIVDLGHTGIFESLVASANMTPDITSDLFSMLQRKSTPDIEALLKNVDCPSDIKSAIISLVSLHGDNGVLNQARKQLSCGGDAVANCINYLETISQELASQLPDVDLRYDLAESHGYHYQQGIVFTAFCSSSGTELARGGRYDNIGESFGRARPATGFSADLRQLIAASNQPVSTRSNMIFAPAMNDNDLVNQIAKLRSEGEIVITALSNDKDEAKHIGCTRTLQKENNQWVIKEI